MLLWLLVALYLCARFIDGVRFTGLPFATVFAAVVLALYCSVCYLVFGEIGYLNGFLQLYLKCLLMYLIGTLARDVVSPGRGWGFILASYVVASCIYICWAMANYFPGFGAWLSSMAYLFEGKNGLGQIVGVAASVFLVNALEESRPGCWRVASLLTFAALTVCILLIQCRTAFLAVCCSAVFLLFLKKRKRTLIGALVLILFALALSPDLRDFFSHAFFLDKYDGADANALSSGRLDLWAEALRNLAGRELVGLGDYYVDNMYINLIANIGIVGALPVMGIWVARAIINFRRGIKSVPRQDPYCILLRMVACLTVFYLVETVLEAHPPFGPGTCSFIFWMLCGYLDSNAVAMKNMPISGPLAETSRRLPTWQSAR